MIRFSAPFECIFINKRPHSAKRPYSNDILAYEYVSTEVHLPFIAHKRTVMPHYKNSGLNRYGKSVFFTAISKLYKIKCPVRSY